MDLHAKKLQDIKKRNKMTVEVKKVEEIIERKH